MAPREDTGGGTDVPQNLPSCPADELRPANTWMKSCTQKMNRPPVSENQKDWQWTSYAAHSFILQINSATAELQVIRSEVTMLCTTMAD